MTARDGLEKKEGEDGPGVAEPSADERLALSIEDLPASEGAGALGELEPLRAADVAEALDPNTAADILAEMEPEDAAHVIEETGTGGVGGAVGDGAGRPCGRSGPDGA